MERQIWKIIVRTASVRTDTKIKILGRGRDKTTREMFEAFEIRKRGDKCVSDTSVKLLKAEIIS